MQKRATPFPKGSSEKELPTTKADAFRLTICIMLFRKAWPWSPQPTVADYQLPAPAPPWQCWPQSPEETTLPRAPFFQTSSRTLFHNTKPGSQYIKPLYAKHSLLGLSKNRFAELGWLCVFTADVEKLETTFPNERSPHYKVCTVS